MKLGYSFDSLVKYVEDIDKTTVKLSGAQTVAGIKTFSDNPLCSAAFPQFDDTTKLATTAFLRKASGGLSGYANYTDSAVVPVADAGKYLIFTPSAAGKVATLPDPRTLPNGVSFHIEVTGQSLIVTCVNAASQSFAGPNMQNPADKHFLPLFAQSDYIVIDGAYRVCGGAGKTLRGTVGYEINPNGTIKQWGLVSSIAAGGTGVFTYQFPFPNGAVSAQATSASGTPANCVPLGTGPGKNSCTVTNGGSQVTTAYVEVRGY